MAATSYLRALYLAYLSNPAVDRPIYRAMRRGKVRGILELGIADGGRARRMIEVAGRYCPLKEIQYTGVDLFEGRSSADGPGMTLKLAHRLLRATAARVRLIPGDPHSALARWANALGPVDLLVVSPRLEPESLAKAWFYVPRLLHAESLVFQEDLLPGGQRALRVVAPAEVHALAAAAATRRAA